MLSEPPDADPHVRWCGGRRGEPGAYPIRCDSARELHLRCCFCLEATAPLRMAALSIALSLIVHTDTDKSSSNPRGHAEWSAASNLR